MVLTARGHGPAAGALRHAPPDLTLIAQHHGGRFPADKVKAVIAGQEQSPAAHGSREMPVWGPVFHGVEWRAWSGLTRCHTLDIVAES